MFTSWRETRLLEGVNISILTAIDVEGMNTRSIQYIIFCVDYLNVEGNTSYTSETGVKKIKLDSMGDIERIRGENIYP